MAFDLPQRRSAKIVQTQKRSIPLEQILAVQGQNPLAMGIETAGNSLGQAIQKRAEIRRQAQQVAQLAALAGEQPPQDIALTPDLYEKGLSLKSSSQAKKAEAAKSRVALEFELEKLRKGYTEVDPLTGAQKIIPGVQGVDVQYDESGNPFINRNENYQAGLQPVKNAPGSTGVAQSTFVDSDGTPLLFDKAARNYIRSDGRPLQGKPVPVKGNAEAVQTVSRAKVLLPKIDTYFDELDKKSGPVARLSTVPGVRAVAFPELNQLRNEVKQIGFTFGGKNFTGNEEKIISDALIPNAYDNKASRKAKRVALKGYLSGQVDLLGAANLLGAAGSQIKSVIGDNTGLQPLPNPTPSQITPQFNSVEAAEKAKLPPGTKIIINGRSATVQ